ncbi:MAG TPA: hypothetical protein V6D28_04630 [Leptolyngbyaceae cyanobacterium]
MAREPIEQPYQSTWKSENSVDLIFNANLQKFAQSISYLCNLETAGKISPIEAFQKMENLWQQLEQSAKEIGIAPW